MCAAAGGGNITSDMINNQISVLNSVGPTSQLITRAYKLCMTPLFDFDHTSIASTTTCETGGS